MGSAIDMLITPDVFMHSWDLARATGQPITLDNTVTYRREGGTVVFDGSTATIIDEWTPGNWDATLCGTIT